MHFFAEMTAAIAGLIFQPCATADNVNNYVTWKIPGHKIHHATYKDFGVGDIEYSRRIPRIAKMAMFTLRYGKVGEKTITVCDWKR